MSVTFGEVVLHLDFERFCLLFDDTVMARSGFDLDHRTYVYRGNLDVHTTVQASVDATRDIPAKDGCTLSELRPCTVTVRTIKDNQYCARIMCYYDTGDRHVPFTLEEPQCNPT